MLGGTDSDKLILGLTLLLGVGLGAAFVFYFLMRDTARQVPATDPSYYRPETNIISRTLAEIAPRHELVHRVANEEAWEFQRDEEGALKNLTIHRDVRS